MKILLLMLALLRMLTSVFKQKHYNHADLFIVPLFIELMFFIRKFAGWNAGGSLPLSIILILAQLKVFNIKFTQIMAIVKI